MVSEDQRALVGSSEQIQAVLLDDAQHEKHVVVHRQADDTIPPSMAPIPAGEARQRMADASAGAREALARCEKLAMGIAAGLDATTANT